MTVPTPVTETTITTVWGTAVANDLNGNTSRIASLEAINAGPRLGTAESEIDALQAGNGRLGRQRSHGGQTVPGSDDWNVVPFGTDEVNAGNIAYSAGVWTVGTTGVYSIHAYTVATTFQDKVTGHSLSLPGGERIRGWRDGGSLHAQWSGLVTAGGQISFQVFTVPTGAMGNVVSLSIGRMNIWRVAA